jgi:kinetochore protein Mis13/DSN1
VEYIQRADFDIAYDEEDGDFKFTRGSKRSKTEAEAPEPAPLPTRRRQSRALHAEPQTEVKKVRRKMSFSTPKADEDTITQPKRATRKSTRSSLDKSQTGATRVNGTGLDGKDYRLKERTIIKEDIKDSANTVGYDVEDMDLVGVSVMSTSTAENSEGNRESTKIALPFADTPVINRNKELRKKGTGGRRSSLGLRGRRASSLIDNGHTAIPHHQVETSQFYKHIEAEGLSEPRRMKQLLTWCGERALGAKPSHNIADSAAVLAGKSCALRSFE